MTPPPFIFNHKTGELSRNGIVTTLPRLHADMFACFAQAQTPIGSGAIARATNQPEHSIKKEMRHLIKRLKLLGIAIARENGRGSWLVFEDVPKWKPNIPEPVRLEGEVS